MSRVPAPIRDLAVEFDQLPGIGPRAALRYAYWAVTQSKERLHRFAQALLALADTMQRCAQCGGWSEAPTCSICLDSRRDRTQLCIVATTQDMQVIEDSGAFKGLYHILNGLLDPIEGRTPEKLNLTKLYQRLQDAETSPKEVIFALDPDMNGDTTTLYITKQISNLPIKISRLARGLPNGAQIEYADGATMADALTNRRQNTV